MTANVGQTVAKTKATGRVRWNVLLRAAVSLVTGFMLAGVSVLGECAPLAVAFVGASGAGLGGVLSLVGAAGGYAVFYGIGTGIQYIAAGVMVYTAAFVCQYIPLYRKRGFMPMIVTVMVGLTMAFGTVSTVRADLPFWLRLGFDVFSSGFFAYLYSGVPSLMEKPPAEWEGAEYLSGAALGISLLAVLAVRLIFGGISVGRVLACLWVMVVSYCGGVIGCGMGTGMGVVMDMVSGGPCFFTMSYAFSALLSGMLRTKGKLLFSVVYGVTAAAVTVLYWEVEETHYVLFEMLLGTAIFLLIPKRLLRRGTALLESTPSGAGEIRQRHYEARRMRRMSEALTTLGKLLQEEDAAPAPQNMDELFDRAAEAVCAGCGRKTVCWTNHYMDMLVILGEAVPVLQRRGRLQSSDLPGYFCDYCPKSNELILAINYELRRNADKRLLGMERHELIAAGAAQYSDFSAVLQSLSDSLILRYGSEARCEQRLHRYLRALELDCEAAAFRDAGGRLRITISGNHLNRLTSRPDYLDELSAVLDMRLCRPTAIPKQTLLLLEAEPYAVTVGVAARKKRGEEVSGDRGRYFKTDSGILYVILSDGLGTGDDAAEQSSIVVDILEQLLRSGIPPMSAMKLVNSAMLLKNRQAWGYATVDLLSVNLFSGETTFLKYGAAPSYVLTGGELRTISGQSLSAGMLDDSAQQPDAATVQLGPGDVVVIASDGVSIGDEHTLMGQIGQEQGSMKGLARRILLSARDADPFGDDMTVLAIGLEARK